MDDEEEEGDDDDLLDQYDDEEEPPKQNLKRKGLDLSDQTRSLYIEKYIKLLILFNRKSEAECYFGV